MPAGRPTLYHPDFCSMLVKHMTEGLSFESFGGVIGTGRSVLYNWLNEYPEFMDAKKLGTEASLLFWEVKGRDALHAEKFQSSVYIFTMKARFKWADQVVIKDEKEEADKAERERIRSLPMSELVKLVKENLTEEE